MCTIEDSWIATDRSRRRARANAMTRHPMLVVRRLVRRQRGVSLDVAVPVSSNEILERLAALPVSVWTYGFDNDSVRHLGPMAQDFASAFGLGDDNTKIDLIDANGVTMAALQALHRRVVRLEHERETERATPLAGASGLDLLKQ